METLEKDLSRNKHLLFNNLKFEENNLTADNFINLRKFGPFIEYKREDVELALKNTLYSISIFEENKLIGIARVVGDGRVVFFIKDVVVHPDYKGKKVGILLMEHIFKYIEQNACINAYIGLMATKNTEGFYEKFGFIRRPNENHGAGMIMYYKGGKIYEKDSSIW